MGVFFGDDAYFPALSTLFHEVYLEPRAFIWSHPDESSTCFWESDFLNCEAERFMGLGKEVKRKAGAAASSAHY